MTEPGLTTEEFRAFSRIAYEKAGITLKPGKESLVAARVGRRVRALNLPDVASYRKFLEADATGQELVAFLDAISTNVTSFFREPAHFDFIRDHVTALLDKGQTRLRFWSAACSSGEEPYTLAMVIDKVVGTRPVDWRILATDISTAMLERATRAVYTERDVSGIPDIYRRSSVVRMKTPGEAEDRWAVVDRLKERVLLRRLNLSEPPFPMPGPIDVILCRNVMIYFDNVVRQGILDEAERLLPPGGVFLISHTETLAALRTTLRVLRPSIARKEP